MSVVCNNFNKVDLKRRGLIQATAALPLLIGAAPIASAAESVKKGSIQEPSPQSLMANVRQNPVAMSYSESEFYSLFEQ